MLNGGKFSCRVHQNVYTLENLISRNFMQLKYYIRNLVGSFIGLCALAGIVTIIFKYSVQPYETTGIIFGVVIMLIGLIAVGYLNTLTIFENRFRNSFYLHCILVIILFTTDLTFGSSDLLSVIARNVFYFVALQLGSYLFKKINSNKIPLVS